MMENTKTVHSLFSDAIFQKLMEKHKVEMLAGAAAMFNESCTTLCRSVC